jgi:type VI secretion system protein VasJ
VWRFAETVLQSKGKDLLMAGYLAYGLYQDRGLTALPTGLMLVVGFVDQYADTMFPSRPRGRSNALAWFTDHLEKALAQENPTPDQRELVITIDRAVKELADVARDKMGDAAPGMSPLRERMQRMLLAVPEKKPQAPPPPKPAAPSPAQPQAQAARPAASAPAMPAVSGDISSAEDVTKFLIDTGKSLVTAAGLLRRADASTPAAYRLIRTGLWLHLSAAPPADAGGKTNVPGLPEARRKQFETILANGKWLAALEETESALQQFRFCLDLNRMSHQALTALGDTHKHAAEAVAAETATLLRRMPDLIDLSAGDGTPFADNETRAWIADNAGSGGGAGPARSTGDDGVPAEALAELRGLMKTKPQDGMKRGMELINAASSPRSKLLCRLALAEACLDADQGKLARGMFAAIDREMQDRGLQDWDPPLVGRCLEGFMRSIRAAAKAGSPYQGSEEIFERLCLVDPAAAAKLG